ncbi:unnamed protein product [Miscanthus lutarioriparius]|uniref:Transposase-associated domain-containing protein n=1 Tax=Miscanthus lutarioriparius TaxID=422564 RepID=A0A811RJ30_9POAL|nr:unnamed protein product [Miscanthus lutarioriparius]
MDKSGLMMMLGKYKEYSKYGKRKCSNSFWKEASEIREHLICDGFLKGYRTWNLHGEPTPSVNHGNCDSDGDGVEVMDESDEDDDISGLLRDLAGGLDDRGDFEDNSPDLDPCEDLVAIQKLVEENSKELFPSCKKYTQLRFLIRLLHTKLLGGWCGNEVILYALQRDEPVAKGIVISRNPSTMCAGHTLGRKHCEVVIGYVMKREAKVPRPYPGVQDMVDAKDL